MMDGHKNWAGLGCFGRKLHALAYFFLGGKSMIHASCLLEFLSVSPASIIYFINKFKLFMLLLSLCRYVIHVILSIADSFHFSSQFIFI